MTAIVAEIFTNGAAGIRRDELQRGGFGCSRRHDDGIVHGTGLSKSIDNLSYGGALLADGNVNADNVAAFLIDDGVDGDGGLAGLAVADDQLALTAADGDHAVDGLQAGLQRLLHGLARDDAGSFEFDTSFFLGIDGAAAVDRSAERVDDASDQFFADGNLGDTAGSFHRIALFDHVGFTEQRGADVVFFEV